MAQGGAVHPWNDPRVWVPLAIGFPVLTGLSRASVKVRNILTIVKAFLFGRSTDEVIVLQCLPD
jgi:hypothetical protein